MIFLLHVWFSDAFTELLSLPGTAFVKFRRKESVDKCLQAAAETHDTGKVIRLFV